MLTAANKTSRFHPGMGKPRAGKAKKFERFAAANKTDRSRPETAEKRGGQPAGLELITLVWTSALLLLPLAVLAAPPESPARPGPDENGFPPPAGLVRIARDGDVWIDMQRKQVIVDGQIALREGALEMFACPKGTKEHESIVAVNAKAQYVHAGLLAVGAVAGHPVRYQPDYVPASGTTVEVTVLWQDARGEKRQAKAQEWVRDVTTGKELQTNWVFAGSSFWTDPTSGEQFYQGDGGDLICVSNFPTATLDLPVESSQANASLLFEAHSERIPPRGTKVRLVLTPKLAKPAESKASPPPASPTNGSKVEKRPP